MIPLRDLNPTRSTPVLTWALIASNVLVFLAATSGGAGDALQAAVDHLGAVAYHFTGASPESLQVIDEYGRRVVIEPVPRSGAWPLRAITHMWMHGGWMHLIGNMWFLYVFGDNVEDRLGKPRFIAFYLLSGLAALVGQIVADPDSGVPMVGASGAIAGVLGGYLRLFPHAKVLTLVPLGFFLTTFVWPAYAYLGIWIGMQLLNATVDSGGTGGGVAWFAHIGGFAIGWLTVSVFEKRREPSALHRRSGMDFD